MKFKNIKNMFTLVADCFDIKTFVIFVKKGNKKKQKD